MCLRIKINFRMDQKLGKNVCVTSPHSVVHLSQKQSSLSRKIKAYRNPMVVSVGNGEGGQRESPPVKEEKFCRTHILYVNTVPVKEGRRGVKV